MAQKSSGSAHGTRHKLAKNSDDTTTVNDHMKEFEEGETVLIKYDASVQDGRSHQRFYGDSAEVVGFRGDAVKLSVTDGKKDKTLFLKPVHLERTEE